MGLPQLQVVAHNDQGLMRIFSLLQVLRDQGYQINNVLTDSKIALGALS